LPFCSSLTGRRLRRRALRSLRNLARPEQPLSLFRFDAGEQSSAVHGRGTRSGFKHALQILDGVATCAPSAADRPLGSDVLALQFLRIFSASPFFAAAADDDLVVRLLNRVSRTGYFVAPHSSSLIHDQIRVADNRSRADDWLNSTMFLRLPRSRADFDARFTA